MDAVVQFYNDFFPDHRLDDYPLMKHPWSALGILSLYWYAIYYYVPAHMANRKPYNLKNVLVVYNICQVLINVFGIYAVATAGWTTHYSVIGCFAVPPPEDEMGLLMARRLWLMWILRMIDLVETVFFILRKKQNQVSVLHVYHHSIVIIAGWMGLRIYPGGMFTFTVMLNCCVHVVLYLYYFVSSLGPEYQKILSKYKSKITTIQLTQLGFIFLHSHQIFLPSCDITFPYSLILFCYVNIFFMIGLFLNFYYKTYVKKKTA